jgi:hypothetical protein
MAVCRSLPGKACMLYAILGHVRDVLHMADSGCQTRGTPVTGGDQCMLRSTADTCKFKRYVVIKDLLCS